MNPPATPVACSVTPTPNPTPTPTGSKPAIPTDGQRYFILGQDQVSIQGYTAQSDLPRPHGLTMYATLSRGERSYDGSYCFKGLDGFAQRSPVNVNRSTRAQSGTLRRMCKARPLPPRGRHARYSRRLLRWLARRRIVRAGYDRTQPQWEYRRRLRRCAIGACIWVDVIGADWRRMTPTIRPD